MKILIASALALAFTGSAAFAQTATESSTSTQETTAPGGVPPVTVERSTHSSQVQDAYGNTKKSDTTMYRDNMGNMERVHKSTTQVAPQPPAVSSSTTTTQSTTAPQ